ncbi:hypothetical protein OPV22_025082 [Ensete ventricosum]|uniref:Uncharacterized protein n=1 Tax=Ensete ventricosum TaxID=4639 RepID=A0AAV8QC05_ENSVE|nr:hypothetical protein OPV22_025082 [Ensete ventricosum]
MEANVASSSSSTFASRTLLLAVCGARINISKKGTNPHHRRHSFPIVNPPGCHRVLRKFKAHNVSVGNFAVPLQCAAFGSKRRTKFYKTIRALAISWESMPRFKR